MSNAATDLASVVVMICHQMCDIAHVLSRCTTIPTPDNEEHKEEIKTGISGLYSNLQQLRATALSLGDVAGFDTTEIEPRTDVPDEVPEKINTITGLMRDRSMKKFSMKKSSMKQRIPQMSLAACCLS